MHLPSHGQLIEGRQVPPATTNPPHRANFGQRFIWRQIVGIHRPRFQIGGESQQHLGHLARGLEPVGSRTVIPLLQTKQFRFDAQELDVPVITLAGKIENDLLQRLRVIRQRGDG